MPAKDGDESRIFAVCGTETIGEIEQIVEQSPGVSKYAQRGRGRFALAGSLEIYAIFQIMQIVSWSVLLQKVLGTCPDGMVISVGFSLSIRGGALGAQNSVFLPCRAGQFGGFVATSNSTERIWIRVVFASQLKLNFGSVRVCDTTSFCFQG